MHAMLRYALMPPCKTKRRGRRAMVHKMVKRGPFADYGRSFHDLLLWRLLDLTACCVCSSCSSGALRTAY